jgi:cyclopropane-fatty-acyl-phospholipid synthase
MNRVLKHFLERAIRSGRLEVAGADGDRNIFGDGSGSPIRLRIVSRKTERDLFLNPELKLGEAFTDGELIVEEGSIYDFLVLVLTNMQTKHPTWTAKTFAVARHITRRLRQINTPLRARHNVEHHYDLDGRMYSKFLDDDMQYSCAYFENDDMSLDEAQVAKKRHIAAKLLLEPGQKVLDIGSGWGGLGLYLAEHFDVDVTGITLSEEQFKVANGRAEERGLATRVRFRLEDYRKVQGPFDRIVSVGMFEHVGVSHYRKFFETCRDLLSVDGVMLLHSISRFDGPTDTSSWTQKYIFPGGYIPAMSEVVPVIEKVGLKLTDAEILRLHYAKTLRAWRERFLANREQIAALTDERFCRMWEYYLATSECGFRFLDLMNFQLQIARHQAAVPLTRDYIGQVEAELGAAGRRGKGRASLRIAGE